MDVEASGGRNHVRLSTICNANTGCFGSQGSELRRRITREFDNIKRRKNIVLYLNLLRKNGVVPSPNTLLEEHQDVGTGGQDDAAETSDDEEEDNYSDTDDTMLASEFNGLLNLNDSSTNALKTSPPRTPLRNSSFVQKKSPASMTKVMKSPSTSASFLQAAAGNGTKKNPFVVNVDVDYPERNSNGFHVQEVLSMRFNDSLHYGFHIRKCIPVQDSAFWEATIAPSAMVSGSRAILVKGPSQSYWFRDPVLYFNRTQNNQCEATRDAHLATNVAIADCGKRGGDEAIDEDRFYLYWLLIFPTNITLDNSIFSPGNTNVLASEVVGMQAKLMHGSKEHIHFGSAIFWRIGVKGMSKQLKAVPTKVQTDLSVLFG